MNHIMAQIGGLVVGALIGGALASEPQTYEPTRAYRSYYYRYPAYDDGYNRDGYVPAHRDRNCDDDYCNVSGCDNDD